MVRNEIGLPAGRSGMIYSSTFLVLNIFKNLENTRVLGVFSLKIKKVKTSYRNGVTIWNAS